MSISEDDAVAAPRKGWSLREITTLIALGAVFAVLYLGWVQLWLVAQAAIGPLAMDIVFGFWFVVSIIAARILMKPGAALLSEVLAAGIQILIGNPAGLLLLLTGLIQGAGAEVAFAATRWKRWGLGVCIASGATAAIASFIYTWVRFNYGALDPSLVASMAALRIASGAILGGVLGWLIVEALYKTGVLRGLPIDLARRGAGQA